MTDIVDRLRVRAILIDGEDELLMDEAADEIERLRAGHARLCDKLGERCDEIERLRAKLAEYENVPVRLRHIMKTGKAPADE